MQFIVYLFNLMWIKHYLQYGFLFIYFVLRYIPLTCVQFKPFDAYVLLLPISYTKQTCGGISYQARCLSQSTLNLSF